ncbi:hypothetical protein DPMN_076060 [Dreissena polymorpha]|uniref:Uncharacterized protein n=1 Tax=Dreissena polymorpha TaxID=45954 RepID=A0A9D3YJE4_DREPO|nr:hypothetical protein DPMN_076060 [Dreissena polymorpha]
MSDYLYTIQSTIGNLRPTRREFGSVGGFQMQTVAPFAWLGGAWFASIKTIAYWQVRTLNLLRYERENF